MTVSTGKPGENLLNTNTNFKARICHYRVRSLPTIERGFWHVTIGFIGLGEMGRGMAHNLIEKGFNLSVYDVRENAADSLPEQAVTVAKRPADLVDSCSTILLCLPSSIEVSGSSAECRQISDSHRYVHTVAG